jgi:hypothetical protein
MVTDEDIAEFVDASAPGAGAADLIFVFGSTLPHAVAPAVQALRAGRAPLIVLTGGPNRRLPEHVESPVHARLLQEQGITPEQMLVERRSQTSRENVLFARPLIEQRLGAVKTILAICKWWQRRQVHVLAAGLPSVERIYTAAWHPPARADGLTYDRSTWASSSDRLRIQSEFTYLTTLLASCELPQLSRTEAGWTRTIEAERAGPRDAQPDVDPQRPRGLPRLKPAPDPRRSVDERRTHQ